MRGTAVLQSGALSDDKNDGKSEGLLAESAELLGIELSGDEDADDVTGGVTRAYPEADAGYGEHGTDGKTANKKRKSLPESDQGKDL